MEENPSKGNVRHILLVDDDADELMLMKDALSELQIPLKISYCNSYSALQEFADRKDFPELVFLDINMPGKDGRDCLQMLRSKKEYDEVTIIMYSNSSFETHIEECRRLGASLYAIKPSSIDHIKKMLEKIILTNWKSTSLTSSKETFVLN